MMKRIFRSMGILVVLMAVAGVLFSCKKETPHQAVATFVVGDVQLLRQGADARAVKHGDILQAKDTVKTGKNSLLAIQVGEQAVIRVTADSSMTISEIVAGKTNKFALEQGSAFATVKKLGKGEGYELQTATTVAAVRGTEFSVTYEKGKSIVAVKEGSVKVQRLDEESKVIEEKMVETGTAAEVTAKESETRPLNEAEEAEFTKVEKIDIIANVHEKSETDLKENENKVLLGEQPKADVVEKLEIPQDNKQATDTEKLKASDKEEQVVLKEKDAGNGAQLWTSKQIYKSGDPVVVGFRNMPDSKYCWISIAKTGTAGGDFILYDWTHSKTDGQMEFTAELEPGTYEARAHYSRSRDISKRTFFKVE